jgi:hypothetical protein
LIERLGEVKSQAFKKFRFQRHDIFALNLLILHGTRQIKPVHRVHILTVLFLLPFCLRGLHRSSSVAHRSPHDKSSFSEKERERERAAHEYQYTKTNAVAQKEKDGRKTRVGEEEEEEEELGKTEKPKGQSAEAVKPAADGRSHHRTLQRQRAGAEGWL